VKIGDVAKRLDIPSSTIRYYEKKGLINPPKRVSGKREFSTSALVTLRFIQLCQAAGFTIVEIRSLLEHYAEDSSKSGLWQPAVETKRTEIRKQIDELKQVDAVLGELMKCRCESIEQCVSLALQDSRWILGDSE
jgi:DNA-binding transcriptional MerR regulator